MTTRPDPLSSIAPALLLGLAVALLGACGAEDRAAWSGYAEGDYVYVAAPVGGFLQQLAVQRGDGVSRGSLLFALDPQPQRAARDEAAARLGAARAQAQDADKGRRDEEIAVIEAQLAQARTAASLADSELARQQGLYAQGFVSPSLVDDARAAARRARQHVNELQAALQVARLPARADERAAASATAEAAREALRQSEWQLEQTRQEAPADGRVTELFFRVGEWVPAGQPVLALLPPAYTYARFFVPEREVGALAPGQEVSLQCDGCGAPIAARIDFIASQPEYTPPVIYSNAQRARLVFMVQARPDAKDATRLKPGQPLDVRPVSR